MYFKNTKYDTFSHTCIKQAPKGKQKCGGFIPWIKADDKYVCKISKCKFLIYNIVCRYRCDGSLWAATSKLMLLANSTLFVFSTLKTETVTCLTLVNTGMSLVCEILWRTQTVKTQTRPKKWRLIWSCLAYFFKRCMGTVPFF